MKRTPSLKVHVGGMVSTNGYLFDTGSEYYVIDAPKGMFDFVKSEGITPKAVLLTHQHYDHVEDASLFSKAGYPVYAYEAYSEELNILKQASRWGMMVNVAPYHVTNETKGSDSLQIGDDEVKLLHIPGHSPDSIAFHFPQTNVVFSGDTLFCGGLGRTDLPLSDDTLLVPAIKKHLLTLEDEVMVFPGHGGQTTIGEERVNNFGLR